MSAIHACVVLGNMQYARRLAMDRHGSAALGDLARMLVDAEGSASVTSMDTAGRVRSGATPSAADDEVLVYLRLRLAFTRALAAAAGVELRPVSEESKVTDVRGKVTSGEADAGIVYVTDARAAGDRVEQIAIPAARTDPNRYQIAVTGRADAAPADAARAEAARRFVDAVTGPSGQAVLAAHGFGLP